MNRNARRLVAKAMREQAKAWPEELAPIPREEWPAQRGGSHPVAVWRSRQYLVQVFEERSVGFLDVLRLSVNRTTRATAGGWEQNIPWEDLQRLKREAGYGDHYAIEVYPRDRDVVNVANMRHLWVLSAPLGIGWFDGDTREAG